MDHFHGNYEYMLKRFTSKFKMLHFGENFSQYVEAFSRVFKSSISCYYVSRPPNFTVQTTFIIYVHNVFQKQLGQLLIKTTVLLNQFRIFKSNNMSKIDVKKSYCLKSGETSLRKTCHKINCFMTIYLFYERSAKCEIFYLFFRLRYRSPLLQGAKRRKITS